jgi:hypothetical protein
VTVTINVNDASQKFFHLSLPTPKSNRYVFTRSGKDLLTMTTAVAILLVSYALVFAAGFGMRAYISHVRRERYGTRGRDHSLARENWV